MYTYEDHCQMKGLFQSLSVGIDGLLLNKN